VWARFGVRMVKYGRNDARRITRRRRSHVRIHDRYGSHEERDAVWLQSGGRKVL